MKSWTVHRPRQWKRERERERTPEQLAMATSTAIGSGKRENTAKTVVADQISQAVQSTSNLLHLMQQSSPSHAQLMKLPKNLLAKVPTIRNTGQVLEQMPQVITSLDAHIENGLQRTLQCSSFENCRPVANKHGEQPAEFSFPGRSFLRGSLLTSESFIKPISCNESGLDDRL